MVRPDQGLDRADHCEVTLRDWGQFLIVGGLPIDWISSVAEDAARRKGNTCSVRRPNPLVLSFRTIGAHFS